MRPPALLLLSLLSLSSGLGSAAPTAGFLTPAQLQTALSARARGQQHFTLVNVHIPYQGHIEGTDVSVPYDVIGQKDGLYSRALPADKAAPLILYCRSGNMSAQAHTTLNQLGYTNVRELKGGFDAWKEAGYPLRVKVRF
ncbi:rhodanese-like domain-containing protein [Deinococcus sp.]|uniref:rhodanese-like domain-containing protein n=1 Tax=Deinococcus sp. TaxID=47478 RepID=UPI003CC53CDC